MYFKDDLQQINMHLQKAHSLFHYLFLLLFIF